MPSYKQAPAAKSRKQPRQRRSLKKKSVSSSGAPANAMAIDMSKSELDGIFFGLHTGQLENPQEALAKVYLLALDSIQTALFSGIADLINNVATLESVQSEDSPIGPWIKRLVDTDPEKLLSFQENLKSKLEDAKLNLQKTITEALATDAEGDDIIGSGSRQLQPALLSFLNNPSDRMNIPTVRNRLSQERLSEIYETIQKPVPAEETKRYRFVNTPGTYRFSFGGDDNKRTSSDAREPSPDAREPSPDAREPSPDTRRPLSDLAGQTSSAAASFHDAHIHCDTPPIIAAKTGKPGGIAGPVPVNAPSEDVIQVSQDIEPTSPHIPIDRPSLTDVGSFADMGMLQSVVDVSLDLSRMAHEVTDAMTELAIQIGNETIRAFAQEHLVKNLSDALRDDPRLSQDDELNTFIHALEDGATDPGAFEDGETIDNDELSRAFSILLDEFSDEGH